MVDMRLLMCACVSRRKTHVLHLWSPSLLSRANYLCVSIVDTRNQNIIHVRFVVDDNKYVYIYIYETVKLTPVYYLVLLVWRRQEYHSHEAVSA